MWFKTIQRSFKMKSKFENEKYDYKMANLRKWILRGKIRGIQI
jgi:hypothetical protein